MLYSEMSKEELEKELEMQKYVYEEYKSLNLALDITRGKPSPEQLDLSMDMMNAEYFSKGKGVLDYRNYGMLDGIPEAKSFFSEVMNIPEANICVTGNSSLNIMHDIIMKFMLFGVLDKGTPWKDQGEVKFICPVPGYDRHFAITELLGIKMINVPLNEDGPDMDMVEELVKNDASIKGMWAIPKYSNPTGTVYSNKVLFRMANMQTAAEDFVIMCDDAYTVHYLTDEPFRQLNLIEACKDAGHPDRAIVLASTSKITFPGAGVAAYAAGDNLIKYLIKLMGYQTIGYDKLNQLRHVNYLKNYDNLLNHMKKHAEILLPKFQQCDRIFEKDLGSKGILKWTKPKGGYFISIDTLEGCATKVVQMAKECGVAVTPAGSSFPYHKDDKDTNIRIAPSLPPVEDLKVAMHVLCVCIKIVSIEKLLEKFA